MIVIIVLLFVIVLTLIAYVGVKGARLPSEDDEDVVSAEDAKKRIIKTMIAGENSRRSAKSGVVRGAVGGALLGPLGMLAGVGSAKQKGKTTFVVQYSDGSRRTVTVKTGGMSFKTYVRYLDM